MLIPVETPKWPYTIGKYYLTVSKLISLSSVFELSLSPRDLFHVETVFLSSKQD